MQEAQASQVTTKLSYWLNEVIFWALNVQALWATYQALLVIFVKLPEHERLLASQALTSSGLNLLIAEAVTAVVSSMISITLALWFAHRRSQLSHITETAVGVMALLASNLIALYLNSQNLHLLLQPIIGQFL